MNKNLVAVIGGMYGDEGKGRMVDYYCSKLRGSSLVVRFNGGAQAGHTVIRDGKRHVFSHVGSGSFLGVPTYLSKEFIVNPILLHKELLELSAKIKKLGLRINKNCRVTTPYDMLVNKTLEESRCQLRHGSVGVGVGETVGRNEFISLLVSDIDLPDYREKVIRIRDYSLSKIRDIVTTADSKIFMNDELLDKFITQSLVITKNCKIVDDEIINEYNNIVFEGAQGLSLDMSYGLFPHVTRSNTGVKNIVEIVKGLGLKDELHCNYLSRCYTTRHGAGPLNYENRMAGINAEDLTNVPNKYQGILRYAPLDLDLFTDLTKRDFNLTSEITATKLITFSHLDQLSSEVGVNFIEGKVLRTIPATKFRRKLLDMSDFSSSGPEASDVNAESLRTREWISKMS